MLLDITLLGDDSFSVLVNISMALVGTRVCIAMMPFRIFNFHWGIRIE